MKKFTLILVGIVVFSLCTASMFASGSEDIKKTYYGVLCGFSSARFIGENSDPSPFYPGGDRGSRLGITLGAFAHLGIGNIFAFEPQILYSQKGCKYSNAVPAWDDQFILKVDYLEVPVIVRVYIPPIPIVKFNVFGGGYFGYNIVAKYRYTETGYEEEGDLDDIFVPNVEDIDYGLAFGAGAVYPIMNVIVRLDFKYSLGLAKIWDFPPDDDIRNGVISVIASFGF